MNEKLLHTPEGLRDIHCNETAKKNEIQKRILAVFHRYGYKHVQTPTFEYYDIYTQDRGTFDTRMMYKFFDRDGSILSLRPDITPSIARFVATAYPNDVTPKRICYLGNTFRNNESYQLKLKEFTQAGVELIGANGADSDAEALVVIINSFLAAGLKDFQIDLGHAGFFKGLVDAAGMDETQAEEMRSFIDEKNYIGLEERLNTVTMNEEAKLALMNMPKLFGQVDVLETARMSTQNETALKALDRLQSVYEILKDYEVEKYVSFDLGMVSKIHYYTGIIFKGFTFGTSDSIVDGGRYDDLLETFGIQSPAIGFAIIIDELMNALERQRIEIPVDNSETLLMYTAETRAIAIKVAESMRMNGMSIETGILKGSVEENIAYGKRYGIGGIMQFTSNEVVQLITIATGEVQFVDVSTLI